MHRSRGWKAFAAWALAGGLLVFSFLSGFSIGLFILPLAGVVLWLVARRTAAWPAGFGIAAGAGAVSLFIAFLHRDYTPCPDGPITLAPGETEFECGGFDPIPWLVAGSVLVSLSVAGYLLVRKFDVGPPKALGLSAGETLALVVALVVAAFGLTLVFGGATGVSGGGGAGVETVEVETVEAPPP